MAAPDWVTLKIFLAALEHGSIRRAAEHCAIAAAAAATRIQALEADYGVPLLERSVRGVKPTAAGAAFARHARALFDLSAHLRTDMRAFAVGGMGSVRLHATASALAGHRLAEALASFAADRPGIRVELREESSIPIVQDLLEGRADLGIVTLSGRLPTGLDAQLWREDRLLAVVVDGHALANRASVSFGEVLDLPLVGMLENGALSLLLEEMARGLGRKPHYRFRVASVETVRRLIAAGHGAGVMPDGLVRPYEGALGIRGIPLSERWSRRRLRIVARPADMLAPAARLLLDHLLSPSTAPTPKGSVRRSRT
jgi:DNA-binding transcriptional LysR family regulator